MLKFSHESVCRDLQYTIPSIELISSFILPEPRKARLIVKRDNLGRILLSKTSSIANYRQMDY